APNPPTAQSKVRPGFFMGLLATQKAISSAPSEGADLNHPSVSGPEWRMSFTKIGKRAVQPPKRTAKRSIVMVASIGLVFQTNFPPSAKDRRVMGSFLIFVF